MSERARDGRTARQLWDVSEELSGVTYRLWLGCRPVLQSAPAASYRRWPAAGDP